MAEGALHQVMGRRDQLHNQIPVKAESRIAAITAG